LKRCPYSIATMQSLGSLSSSFSGQLQAFQGRNVQVAPQRGQLQVSLGGGGRTLGAGITPLGVANF
jgi:hypothetical protein